MKDTRFVQIRHSRTNATGQPHFHRRTERLGNVSQQLLQRAAVDVLGEGVQLTLVNADAHETVCVCVLFTGGKTVRLFSAFAQVSRVRLAYLSIFG